MKKNILILICFVGAFYAKAQTSILCTTPVAEQIMKGNYNPVTYQASTIITDPAVISAEINSRVSADSLHSYLNQMKKFQNRNTLSDTLSTTKGIGAARKWAFSKFEQFSAQNENRLIASYIQYDYDYSSSCPNSITRHKNTCAVLPGNDTTDKAVIIIEAHLDTRCSNNCDTACLAEGMEDNGSGSALVLELARVMSKYTFKQTIVFILTTSEEQGLNGAKAVADFVKAKGIKVKGVLNNDVIGGVICGHTSSPPSCPGYATIDSTQVRLFSYGGVNSFHKGLARFIKLEYKEMIKPIAKVPMKVSIMTAEDRTGRGGDHIPFRNLGYTAMRFTSANENGDASNGTGYIDRQHTSSDILGADTNNDMVLDSFYVDFNYLARNAVINGNAAAMMALGPKTPDFNLTSDTYDHLFIEITQQTQYLNYRIGVRTTSHDFDSVYTFSGAKSLFDTITVATTGNHFVSVASVDSKGIESLFSKELTKALTNVNDISPAPNGIELLQNKPNPSDETTMITVMINKSIDYKDAYIFIYDITGKEVSHLPIILKDGINEVIYDHGYNMVGTYIYTLVVDGKQIQSKRMTFTN
ncbi:MAG: M28 family peptidase [Bacteroidetes bacterium]|nr:M28 family peptidase [Bacteroidota bacterium]